MAINSSTKFGVVYSTPSDFVSKIGSASNTSGKLYVLQGNTSGGVTQGIYMVESNSNDPDGMTNVTMLSSGALATSTNAGLMSSTDCSKLAGIAAGANNYTHPKAGTGTIDTPSNTSTATTLLTRVKIDSSGHVTDTSAFNGTVGDASTPIYFNAGVPTALSYTIKTSVPANAVFTDTWRTIKVNGSEKISSTASTALDISGGTNIDVSYNNNKVVISAKNVDASTADKVANSFKVQGDGTDIITFNGSAAKTINIVGGTNVSLTKDTTNGKITINAGIPGALVYRGVVSTLAEINAKSCTTNDKGDVYVASANFSGTIAKNNLSYTIEKGDMFICNGSSWDIVNGEGQVTNSFATLEYAKSATIATVDGVDITLTGPATPVTSLGGKTGAITLGTATESNDKSVNFSIDGSNKISATVPSLSNYLTSSSASTTYLSKTDANTTYLKISDASYFNTIKVGDVSIVADSSKDTLTFVAGDNITLTPDASNDRITITATDTVYSHPVAGTGSIDTPSTTTTATTLLTRVKIDSSGHVTDTSAFNGTVGSTTTPIYFKAGVPTALSYTIAKSVPSNAVFTDTKCTGVTINVDSSVDVPESALYADVVSNTTISLSGDGTSLSGTMTSVRVATQKAVDAAQEAATIYWETL